MPEFVGNYAKFLKNLHSEQINKLILKNQHECELLEDIRTFTIKRSAIEKSYSEALLKISSAYLNKKIPNIPDIKLEGGEEKWNMWNVWRTVLEENEKLARARLAAVEVFQQQIADDAKILRAHKLQTAKKCVDQLAMVHKELQACVQDVDKTKKLYFDEEHSAHDVRDKARDIEEKLKKKKGSFFQSITSLQKNSAKFSSKRDQLEEKSTGARNDYLLCLSAANAHQTRYFVVDLQLAMTTMESGVYDKVAEYLTLMARTELLTCSALQNSFTIIRDQAKQLTRDYNLQCCYLYYPVLKQHIQYDFDPCDSDPVDHITADHESSAATLSKEARRWATKIARENNNIKESVRKLQIYNALRESGQRLDPNDQQGPDLETKSEEMKQAIRRAETAKAKAEARIECLRKGGVNVDEWLQEAESLNVQDIQRSTSSLSDHPSSDSFYDSDFAEMEQPVVQAEPKVEREQEPQEYSPAPSQDHFESTEVDGEWAMLEHERQKIEQLTAGWDDPTQVDWGAEEDGADAGVEGFARTDSHAGPLLKCTALYSYTAQNPDELTIVENEQLEVVGEGDGDGWLRARNYRGEEGYVPHNYLDVEQEDEAEAAALAGGGVGEGGGGGGAARSGSVGDHRLRQQISFSSVDYTVDDVDAGAGQADTAVQSPEQISVISIPTQKEAEKDAISYCIALYDYEGEEDGDELTFDEGQIIRVVSKRAHDVDDGWWRGELDGRVGNFPSLVVEECDEYGEPLTGQWSDSPPPSAPPVFTPPGGPLAGDGDADDEADSTFSYIPAQSAPDPPAGAPPPAAPPAAAAAAPPVAPPPAAPAPPVAPPTAAPFQMELSRDQQHHYGTQFGSSDVPAIDVPSVEIQDENGDDVSQENDKEGDDFGLGVAQIVITAATPMMEEPEHPFPSAEESPSVNHDQEAHNGVIIEEEEEEEEEDNPPIRERGPSGTAEITEIENRIDTIAEEPEEAAEEQPGADSAPCPVSSSTGSDGETTGPSTAENSVSQAPPPPADAEPKQVVGGRASIPDELEPHQLARLQDLKESNA